MAKGKESISCKPDPARKFTAEELSRPPRFVVQKHSARTLHYDFRLEMFDEKQGIPVLVSFAIPKGPSLSTTEKRLAVEVDEHSVDYFDFEGVIEEGKYGAGNVIVWDMGYFLPLNALLSEGKCPTKEEAENMLETGKIEGAPSVGKVLKSAWLEKGKLEFVLAGKRLKGRFTLLRFRGGDKANWLLIKASDKWASPENVVKKFDTSIKSGKRVEEISE